MKKLFIILGIVVLVVLAIAIWFLVTLDLNSYIPKIEKAVKEQAGQDLTIGKIGISFTGGLALKAENVTLKTYGDVAVSGKLDQFYIQVRLLPLLKRSIDISKIILNRPVVTVTAVKPASPALSDAAEGTLAPSAADKKKSPKSGAGDVETTSPGGSIPLPIQDLGLKVFQIKDGVLVYQDDSTLESKRFTLDRVNLKLESVSSNARESQFKVKGALYLDASPVQLNGSLGPLDLSSQGLAALEPDQIPFRAELAADNLILVLLEKFSPKLVSQLQEVSIRGSEALTLTLEGTASDLKMSLTDTATAQEIRFKDYFDKKIDTPLELKVEGGLSGNDQFSLEKAQLDLDRLSLGAAGKIMLAENTLRNFELQIASYPLDSLGNVVPRARPLGLGGNLSAKLNLKNFNWVRKAGVLEGIVNAEPFSVKLKEFKSPLETTRLSILVNERQIIWTPTIFHWGQGTLTVKGEVSDYLGLPQFTLKGEVRKVELSEALSFSQAKDQISVRGLLSGKIDLAGQEMKNVPPLKTLSGNFGFIIEKGALQNLNIIDEIGTQTAKVPGLSGSLTQALEKRFPRLAQSPDTEFEKAEVTGRVVDGKVFLPQILLESPEFNVVGEGQYDLLTQYLNFSGQLIFSVEATEALMSSVKELGYLRGSDGKLTFSFTVTGKGNDVRVSLLKELVQDAFQKLILGQGAQAVFGDKSSSPAPPKDGAPTAPEKTDGTTAPTQAPASVDELIQYGLDQFLKKNSK